MKRRLGIFVAALGGVARFLRGKAGPGAGSASLLPHADAPPEGAPARVAPPGRNFVGEARATRAEQRL